MSSRVTVPMVQLDLSQHIFKNPEATMMGWMRGDAFGDDGVDDGDRQVADSSVLSQKDTVSDGRLDRGL